MSQNNLDPVQRVIHDLKRRYITVVEVIDLTPSMRRVRFSSEDLQDLQIAEFAPEAHVKLFFPESDGDSIKMPVIDDKFNADWTGAKEGVFSPFRDYTIRHFDRSKLELTIDFVKHSHGVGGSWAMQAKVGDTIGMLGPRSSKVPRVSDKHFVLICDETGVPALNRWLESLPAGIDVDAHVCVRNEQCIFPLVERENTSVKWYFGSAMEEDVSFAQSVINELNVSAQSYVWSATEAQDNVILKRYLIQEIKLPRSNLDLVVYWNKKRRSE